MPKRFLQEESLSVYTALNLPTVIASPSLRCIQWSSDGQVCFMTKNAAYIFTPDLGINLDTDSVLKTTLNKDDHTLGWFKSMILVDKPTPMKWPDYSQEWGAVSLGSLDMTLASIVISPSGVSSYGACVYATLTSNMDVIIWMASKNYLKGEWVKVFEITPYLLEKVVLEDDDKHTSAAVLQAQITSMEWTPQIDFGIVPTPWLDASLLALGSRAGFITFLRYQSGSPPDYIGNISISDKWVVQLTFDSWSMVTPGHYEGYLAYATSDGSVGLVKITQNLHLIEDGPLFVPRYNIIVKFEHQEDLVYGPKGNKGTTSLKWVHVLGRSSILFSSTPGQVKLFSSSSKASASSHWSGHKTFRLRTQKTCRDSSALHPVSGIHYIHESDILLVTLFDGSWHVIRSFSVDPQIYESGLESDISSSSPADHVEDGNLGPSESGSGKTSRKVGRDQLTSKGLSDLSRTMFERAEKGPAGWSDMVRINGAVGYDENAMIGGVVIWAYEASRPSDFSYKNDAKHSNTLMVTQMWDDDSGEVDILVRDRKLVERLGILLKGVKNSSGLAPLHLLRPFYFYLRDPKRLERMHKEFLDVLRPNSVAPEEDCSKTVIVTPWRRDADELLQNELRGQFRVGLGTHLFGWDELLSLRMKLSLADFAWKTSNNEERRAECGIVAQGLLNAISHRLMRIIIRYLVAVVGSIGANELPFVSRMIVQSMLAGSPNDLSEEGKDLSALIQPLTYSSTTLPIHPTEGNTSLTISHLSEMCPACGVLVPMEDITSAQCQNGHAWARCSVTTFLLSTPCVRTCVGCSRKAFLPKSRLREGQELPEIARGWVVEELLEAVRRCLFCGNGFVEIL